MSHFTVLVINTQGIDDVEDQLAPFDEQIEMPRYSEGEVSQEEKDRFVNYYVEKDASLKDKSFKEIFELHAEDWTCGWELSSDGETVISYSTYNPKSKWDWYQTGGRWAGMLKAKENTIRRPPNFSWGWNDSAKLEVMNSRMVDQAHMKDIDWDGMIDPDKHKRALRFWELYVDGEKPKNEEEQQIIDRGFYKREYYVKEYGNKEDYANRMVQFGTFAVLKDGEWFEKGEMGWFGCSSETHEESQDWDNNFHDTFLKDLPENALLTVVDCHI